MNICRVDGWTKSDLVYVWKDDDAVQIPRNLSLPGGFKLGGYGNQYCDVVTATGKVQIPWNLSLPGGFKLGGYVNQYCDDVVTATGKVQIPRNLSLPGGFKLGGYGNQYCDVVTATGKV